MFTTTCKPELLICSRLSSNLKWLSMALIWYIIGIELYYGITCISGKLDISMTLLIYPFPNVLLAFPTPMASATA